MNNFLRRLTYWSELKMLARVLGLRGILRDQYFRWSLPADVKPQAIVDFLHSIGFASPFRHISRPGAQTGNLSAQELV